MSNKKKKPGKDIWLIAGGTGSNKKISQGLKSKMQAIKRQATKALATKRQAKGSPRKLKSDTKMEDIQKCHGEQNRPKNKGAD